MLKHVVVFKFRKDIPETDIAEIEGGLSVLPAAIPEIREYVLGRDVVRTERSYDFALVSSFENVDALKCYQVHPAHQAVVDKIKKACDSILAVDFEY